ENRGGEARIVDEIADVLQRRVEGLGGRGDQSFVGAEAIIGPDRYLCQRQPHHRPQGHVFHLGQANRGVHDLGGVLAERLGVDAQGYFFPLGKLFFQRRQQLAQWHLRRLDRDFLSQELSGLPDRRLLLRRSFLQGVCPRRTRRSVRQRQGNDGGRYPETN